MSNGNQQNIQTMAFLQEDRTTTEVDTKHYIIKITLKIKKKIVCCPLIILICKSAHCYSCVHVWCSCAFWFLHKHKQSYQQINRAWRCVYCHCFKSSQEAIITLCVNSRAHHRRPVWCYHMPVSRGGIVIKLSQPGLWREGDSGQRHSLNHQCR